MHRLRIVVVTGLLIAVGGCGWPQARFDSAGSANNVFERVIGPASVAQLRPSWRVTAPGASIYRPPVIAGGRVFAARGATALDAYDETSGAPRWTFTPPAVAGGALGGVIAVANRANGGPVVLFGRSNLGTPLDPRRTGTVWALDVGDGHVVWSANGSPQGTVVGSTLFVGTNRSLGDAADFQGTLALDADTGAERFRAPGFFAAVAAGGSVFGGVGADVAALPAAGCGAQACLPTWTADYGPASGPHAFAVGSGSLFLVGRDGLEVFDAAGCGRRTCSAHWTAAGSYGAIAVTATTAFLTDDWIHGTGPNVLSAFDARGCGAATCVPRWRSPVAREYLEPVVANGLVFVSSRGDPTEAYSVDGCGGATTCAPVWSMAVPMPVPVQPVVADGRLLLVGTDIATFTPSAPR